MKLLWLCVVVVCVVGVCGEGKNIYVENGAVDGTGDQTAPFGDLQSAMTVVENGDTIVLAPGKYPSKNNVGLVTSQDKKRFDIFVEDYQNVDHFAEFDLSDSNGIPFFSGVSENFANTFIAIKFTGAQQGNIIEVSGEGGSIQLKGMSFVDNVVEGGHCVMATGNSTLELNNVTFVQNGGTTNNGPAIYLRSPKPQTPGPFCSIYSSLFQNNVGGDYGGAIFVSGFTTLELFGNTFEGNSAKYGGGLWSDGATALLFSMSVFDGNSAETGSAIGVTGKSVINIIMSHFNGASVDMSHKDEALIDISGAISTSIHETSFLSSNDYFQSQNAKFLQTNNIILTLVLSSLSFPPPLGAEGSICQQKDILNCVFVNLTATDVEVTDTSVSEWTITNSTLKCLDSQVNMGGSNVFSGSEVYVAGDLYADEIHWEKGGFFSTINYDGQAQINLKKTFFKGEKPFSFENIAAFYSEIFTLEFSRSNVNVDFSEGDVTAKEMNLVRGSLRTPMIVAEESVTFSSQTIIEGKFVFKHDSKVTVNGYTTPPPIINGTLLIDKRVTLNNVQRWPEPGDETVLFEYDEREGEFAEQDWEWSNLGDEDDFFADFGMFPPHSSLKYNEYSVDMVFSQNYGLIAFEVIGYLLLALFVFGILYILFRVGRNWYQKRQQYETEGFEVMGE